jgi:hypothetical protein
MSNPNGMFAFLGKLVAKTPEERVDMIRSCVYHHQLPHMSKVQTDVFQHPCIQNVNTKNEPGCIWYSNTNSKGHFGVPKIIFGRNHSGVYLDQEGKFGIADDCCGIVDDLSNLARMHGVLLSPSFRSVMKMCDVGGKEDTYNRKVIALFRKDFWRDFQ